MVKKHRQIEIAASICSRNSSRERLEKLSLRSRLGETFAGCVASGPETEEPGF